MYSLEQTIQNNNNAMCLVKRGLPIKLATSNQLTRQAIIHRAVKPYRDAGYAPIIGDDGVIIGQYLCTKEAKTE